MGRPFTPAQRLGLCGEIVETAKYVRIADGNFRETLPKAKSFYLGLGRNFAK
jgi:hypothetical protein